MIMVDGRGGKTTDSNPPKMKGKRRRHDSEFKARVALEALRGIKTIQQIAKEFDIHPVQVSAWKKIMADGAASVFCPGNATGEARKGSVLEFRICTPLPHRYLPLMPRAPRIEYEDAAYHVMARGNRRQDIVFNDSDRELFAETLAEACALAKFKTYAWVLMDNHYHWVLETPKANLVEGMTWFQN